MHKSGMSEAKRLLLAICLILFSFSGVAQVAELKLVSDVWPPFTNVEPHRAFAIDLVNEALKRTGIKASSEILEFQDVLVGIREGNYDGSAALWYSEDREAFLIYSAPYLQNQIILVGRKGSDVSMSTFEELKGKRVAIVDNYAYGSEIENAEVELVPGASDQKNLERLLKEEVDYMLVDALLMQYLATNQPQDVITHLQVGRATLFRKPLHFAVRKDIQGAASIIDRFNREIIKMISDGTYNRILEVNWIRADIDGDGKMEMVAGQHAGKAAPTNSYDVWFQSTPTSDNSGSYYVGGQAYQGWDNVPPEYKVQPVDEKQEDFKLMKFNF